MNGITLDIFPVILLVMLAFTWGINAGKAMAKEEIRRNLNSFFKSFTGLNNSKKPENIATVTMTQAPENGNEFWKLFIEPDDKTKKGENDQK